MCQRAHQLNVFLSCRLVGSVVFPWFSPLYSAASTINFHCDLANCTEGERERDSHTPEWWCVRYARRKRHHQLPDVRIKRNLFLSGWWKLLQNACVCVSVDVCVLARTRSNICSAIINNNSQQSYAEYRWSTYQDYPRPPLRLFLAR